MELSENKPTIAELRKRFPQWEWEVKRLCFGSCEYTGHKGLDWVNVYPRARYYTAENGCDMWGTAGWYVGDSKGTEPVLWFLWDGEAL